MRHVVALLAILTLLSPLGSLSAQGSLQATEAANAYAEKDFLAAIQGYQTLINDGYSTPDVYFNLGNAYHRAGELGEAILAYKNALKLSPRDADIQTNLDFLRAQSEEQLTTDNGDPELGSLFFWYDALSLSELTVIAILLNALFFMGVFKFYRRKQQGKEAPLALWIPITFVAMLVMASTAVIRQWDDSKTPGAVILYPEVTARSDTDVKGVALFYLHEGAEIEALGGDSNGWTQLRLPDGRRGWVQSEFVGIVCAPNCSD